MKKKKGLPRLFEIAGEKKGLLILAGVLSALSACCMLIPYLAVYQVLNNLLENAGEINNVNKEYLTDWGWIAFAGLIGGLLLLYGALMSSHMAAFRILYGLRVRLSEHIGRLPLGYLNNSSTGAIKKALEQNVEKIELFIAHTIPDHGSSDVRPLFQPQRMDGSSLPAGHCHQHTRSILTDVRPEVKRFFPPIL